MTLPRLSVLLALMGGALVLAGVLVGSGGWVELEGAYFTRTPDEPDFKGIFSGVGRGVGLLSPSDGNLWLGAGIALLLAAAGALFAHGAGLRLVRAQD